MTLWSSADAESATLGKASARFAVNGLSIDTRTLKEGDLVFFDFDGKQFSHVGVYLQNGFVVHASSTRGVMIVNLHSPSMYKYFSRCGSVIDQPVTAQN